MKPEMMSKEPERKTNRHAHSDQYTGPFSKRKIKEVFSVMDPKQGYSGLFVQKKAKKEGLTQQTMHSCVCTIL